MLIQTWIKTLKVKWGYSDEKVDRDVDDVTGSVDYR